MDQETIISEMEARAKALGLNIGKLCEIAGVHHTTFSRWKRSERNPVPMSANIGSLNKIELVLVQMEKAS